ncbi:MAG: hypothetical protein ACK56F_32025 [bacterium]
MASVDHGSRPLPYPRMFPLSCLTSVRSPTGLQPSLRSKTCRSAGWKLLVAR